jgi:hypothetical protein
MLVTFEGGAHWHAVPASGRRRAGASPGAAEFKAPTPTAKDSILAAPLPRSAGGLGDGLPSDIMRGGQGMGEPMLCVLPVAEGAEARREGGSPGGGEPVARDAATGAGGTDGERTQAGGAPDGAPLGLSGLEALAAAAAAHGAACAERHAAAMQHNAWPEPPSKVRLASSFQGLVGPGQPLPAFPSCWGGKITRRHVLGLAVPAQDPSCPKRLPLTAASPLTCQRPRLLAPWELAHLPGSYAGRALAPVRRCSMPPPHCWKPGAVPSLEAGGSGGRSSGSGRDWASSASGGVHHAGSNNGWGSSRGDGEGADANVASACGSPGYVPWDVVAAVAAMAAAVAAAAGVSSEVQRAPMLAVGAAA